MRHAFAVSAIVGFLCMCHAPALSLHTAEDLESKDWEGTVMPKSGGDASNDVNAKRRDEFNVLQGMFSKSKYLVVSGTVMTAAGNSQPGRIVTHEESQELEMIRAALEAIQGRLSIRDGSRVVVEGDEQYFYIMFENKLPEGSRGGDYSARVTIDKKTGAIVQVLSGG